MKLIPFCDGGADINRVYVSIDSTSQYTIIISFYMDNAIVICGIEGKYDSSDSSTICIDHINELRKNQRLRHTNIVVIIESNLGFEPQHIVDKLLALYNVTVFCNTTASYGIFATSELFKEYDKYIEDTTLRMAYSLNIANISYVGNDKLAYIHESILALTASNDNHGYMDHKNTDDSVVCVHHAPKDVPNYISKAGLVEVFLQGIYWANNYMFDRNIIERNYTNKLNLSQYETTRVQSEFAKLSM